ncbi:armadillo-type protein [Cladochytrium replicatum]|nr:armadillo-type protein [Cladochytrium replicatum]
MLANQDMHDVELLHSLLERCLSPNTTVRQAAEIELKRLQTAPEFALVATRVALQNNLNADVRQLAALSLKGYASKCWVTSDGGSCPQSVKAEVRRLLPQGLLETNSKIRTAIATVIAKIAQFDYPEEWGDLADILLSGIQSTAGETWQISSVHGALSVLRDMEFTQIQLPAVCSVLVPEIHRIVCSPTFDLEVKVDGFAVIDQIFETLSNMMEAFPNEVNNLLSIILGPWLQTMQLVLSDLSDLSDNALLLKVEAGRTAKRVFSSFLAACRPSWLSYFQVTANALRGLLPTYLGSINAAQQRSGDGVDDPKRPLQSYLRTLAEFMTTLFLKYRPIWHRSALSERNKPSEGYINLIADLIYYTQVADSEVETWLDDFNAFVENEAEESYSLSVRDEMTELITELVEEDEKIGKLTVTSIINNTVRILTQATHDRDAALDPHWWKKHECVLKLLGRSNSNISDRARDGSFDLKGLLDAVVWQDMQLAQYPILQARCVWFIGRFAELLSESMPDAISTVVSALASEVPAVVKMSAVSAVQDFFMVGKPSAFRNAHGSILSLLLTLFSVDLQTLAVTNVLETLTLILKANTALVNDHIVDLCRVWLAVSQPNLGKDDVMLSLLCDLLDAIVKGASPESFAGLQEHIIPDFTARLKSGEEQEQAGIIRCIAILVKRSPSPLAPIHFSLVFLEVMEIILSASLSQSRVLEEGQLWLKMVIAKDVSGVISWRSGDLVGLEIVLRFLGRMISEGEEDSLTHVGEPVVQLILKGGDSLTPVLPELLTALVQRLGRAGKHAFIQTLVIVFAHLIRLQVVTVVDFLANVRVAMAMEGGVEERNGLDVLLSKWCEHFQSFSGVYATKVSIAAMCTLFACPDSRLSSINVIGELISDESEQGVKTRSKSLRAPNRYTKIAFPVKALKLLIHEYERAALRGEMEDDAINFLDEEEDDDEYEDIDDEEENDDLDAVVSSLGGGVFASGKPRHFRSILFV